jgi:hypothetical protein
MTQPPSPLTMLLSRHTKRLEGVATPAKKLLLSTGAVRVVCRPKCLLLRTNHTPDPYQQDLLTLHSADAARPRRRGD